MKERGSQDPDLRLLHQRRQDCRSIISTESFPFEITLSPLPTPFTGVCVLTHRPHPAVLPFYNEKAHFRRCAVLSSRVLSQPVSAAARRLHRAAIFGVRINFSSCSQGFLFPNTSVEGERFVFTVAEHVQNTHPTDPDSISFPPFQCINMFSSVRRICSRRTRRERKGLSTTSTVKVSVLRPGNSSIPAEGAIDRVMRV